MTDRVSVGNLRVAQVLYDFVNNEALPGTLIDPDSFWAGWTRSSPTCSRRTRTCWSAAITAGADPSTTASTSSSRWTRRAIASSSPKSVICSPNPLTSASTTAGVDDEITTTAGPRLVVPVLNARFALNAANARWGSLYDALYGTDVIPESDGAEKGTSYNRVRGDKVIAYARTFLDEAVPLASGSWADTTGLSVEEGHLKVATADGSVELPARRSFSATPVSSARPVGRCCWSTTACTSRSWSTQVPDRQDRQGGHQRRRAGVGDHHDHGLRGLGRRCRRRGQGVGYRNWLGLNKGDLSEEVARAARPPPGCSTRTAPTRHPTAAN